MLLPSEGYRLTYYRSRTQPAISNDPLIPALAQAHQSASYWTKIGPRFHGVNKRASCVG
jgi:hypothetical protein